MATATIPTTASSHGYSHDYSDDEVIFDLFFNNFCFCESKKELKMSIILFHYD